MSENFDVHQSIVDTSIVAEVLDGQGPWIALHELFYLAAKKCGWVEICRIHERLDSKKFRWRISFLESRSLWLWIKQWASSHSNFSMIIFLTLIWVCYGLQVIQDFFKVSTPQPSKWLKSKTFAHNLMLSLQGLKWCASCYIFPEAPMTIGQVF